MFQLDLMTLEDVPEVARVERRCFTNPWPQSAYRRELRYPEQNYYIVLRDTDGQGRSTPANSRNDVPRRALTRLVTSLARKADEAQSAPVIAGFAGMWVMYDEAHITTIGVDPEYRGQGFGELMLVALFDEAIRRHASLLTLEVRVTNTVAQRLYEKYGMSVQGIRARYYTDNGEDAYIMWSRSLRDPEFLAQFEHLRRGMLARQETRLNDSDVLSSEPGVELPDIAQ
jgi:ribosomal-protein-alanine N-acetyltransferase